MRFLGLTLSVVVMAACGGSTTNSSPNADAGTGSTIDSGTATRDTGSTCTGTEPSCTGCCREPIAAECTDAGWRCPIFDCPNAGFCGNGDAASGNDTFWLGTYTGCAVGADDGSLNSGGFEPGVSLTLAQSGQTLTATYVDDNGAVSSFDFTSTTSTTATLASSGKTVSGFVISCTDGPGDSWLVPAVMRVTAGALTYDDGTVFVNLVGNVQDQQTDAGECGSTALPSKFWALCEDRHGGAPATEPPDAAAPPASNLPVGQYTCGSDVETYDVVGGEKEYVTGGGTGGTLTLTQTGTEVTAEYDGDSSIAGTIHFTATTATTAIAEENQTLMAPCTVPIAPGTGGGPSPTPQVLPIGAGSLSVVGSTLFLSFAGTMGASSSCSGASMGGSLICSKQ